MLAYLLHLGNVVPDDFELSDKTMADVQARLPNRNGMKCSTSRSGGWTASRMCRAATA
ncbi:MAG: hypothetical protein R3E68_12485 [Burkholderiaceae bacterium]